MSDLLGRSAEIAALEQALKGVRDGLSGVLVLRGQAGVGKTALLEWTAAQARDMQLGRVAGVQAEMGMGFAGLHQLLLPFLGGLDGLPSPQMQALGSAFGLLDGPPPERFLVGLAALTLLTDAAGEQPVLCVVDDAQWIDQVSVEVLGFIARRLYADRVGMVFTVREGEGEECAVALAGLPELAVGGLPADAARQLLAASIGTPVDSRVSAQIIAGVAGNPLALLELAGELTAEEAAGTVALAWPLRFGGRLEELYLARVRALPAVIQTLLLVAAADPSGDPELVDKAAAELGVSLDAAWASGTEQLVSWQPQVRFRHPLIRSAAYYAASAQQRRQAHAALAAVTDAGSDPDRRAWHLAEATFGPDEQVAAELQQSAGRAQARGGLAAAAAFLERSVQFTADPARHAERSLAAAQVSIEVGAFARALELLTAAEAGGPESLGEFGSAQVDLMRGHIVYFSRMGSDASALLIKAARRLTPHNLELARHAYLKAWGAASLTAQQVGADLMLEISRAARALPPPVGQPRPIDLVLDALALLTTEGAAAAAPALRRTVDFFTTEDISREAGLQYGWMAAGILWDVESARSIMARHVQLAREVGAFDELAFDLVALAQWEIWAGDFASAASLLAEADAVADVTGMSIAPYSHMFLASLRGDEAGFTDLLATTSGKSDGQEIGATGWAQSRVCLNAAILYNGLGRYDDAFSQAEQARDHKHLYISAWVLPELIEAAMRTGHRQAAIDAADELAATTQVGGTDFGLGLQARSRALVTDGQAAEGWYREAIDHLAHTGFRPDTARAHLLYGEWLRRQRRRRDARDQLRSAFEMFDSVGAGAFAARARIELLATGDYARPRPAARQLLSPQEEQIARLVADHLSNREIAARLFISSSTVEYHLRKIFRKLGVSSRAEVAKSMRDRA